MTSVMSMNRSIVVVTAFVFAYQFCCLCSEHGRKFYSTNVPDDNSMFNMSLAQFRVKSEEIF